MSGTHLPELIEPDAPANIRAIYAEIRELSGVPMAALIWRHLATLPGLIEELWCAARPLMAAGQVQEAAWSLAATAALPATARIDRLALRAAGVGPQDESAVRAVLAAYNRMNPVNLMLLATLGARLGRPDGQPAVTLVGRAWSAPRSAGPLPPMTAPVDIAPGLAALIASLTSAPRTALGAAAATTAVIPSLYRHLTSWPGLLALYHVVLMPRLADGSIAAAITDLQAATTRVADVHSAHLPPLPRLAASPHAAAAIVRFSRLIPEMIVIGFLLERAMPGESSTA